MKFILAFALTLSSLSAFSHSHGEKDKDWEKKWNAMSFEDAKKMKMEKIATKREALGEQEKCVSAATDKDGLKACKKEWRKDMKEMKAKKK